MKNSNLKKSFIGKGIYPHKWAFLLLIPFRNIFLSPKKLIQRLELQKNSVVLEMGPGPGYFSVPVAKHISEGKLYLADIQQEMLDFAKRRLLKKKITNVEYHLCDGNVLPYEDNKFDVIFMVTVLGEIENKIQYIKEFHRVLKNHGILSISELWGDTDKISINEIKQLMESIKGFEFYKLYGNENNFNINFMKI